MEGLFEALLQFLFEIVAEIIGEIVGEILSEIPSIISHHAHNLNLPIEISYSDEIIQLNLFE